MIVEPAESSRTSEENSLHTIRAFKQISADLGTAGQPTLPQFRDIAAAGYTAVINLLPTAQQIAEEPEAVAAFAMEYVNIPVVWTQPEIVDLRSFFDAMNARRNQKVFVHCAGNMRVSVFVYLYRILCDRADPEAAEDDLYDIWVPEGVWRTFIDRALGLSHGLVHGSPPPP